MGRNDGLPALGDPASASREVQAVHAETGVCGMAAVLEQGMSGSQPVVVVPQELQWLGAENVFSRECSGTSWRVEGLILEYDQYARTFERKSSSSPAKRQHDSFSDNYVLDVQLADYSGPMSLCLWGSVAEFF